jgi:UDP-N-acetylglucosamine/UDP-N-acetylgalactosamine 4-epimerase
LKESNVDPVSTSLRAAKRTFVVTGAAGFIGSHLTDALLAVGHTVRAVDNLATGHKKNLDDARHHAGFSFTEADINDAAAMAHVCRGADVVMHQAALGSVPRSIADPLATHHANVSGFVSMLQTAVSCGVRRFVFASSSSVYGDEPNLPKVEDRIGRVLSPYAASKRINEVYAEAFQKSYDIGCIGLRYFNVFGPRQDPNGPYAAVIPKWVASLLQNQGCVIHGDGETSRDFCYVKNAVQANILAAVAGADATGKNYNVACGARTTLTSLFGMLRDGLAASGRTSTSMLTYGPFRAGDVRHSLADVGLAAAHLGYAPTHDVAAGVAEALPWYVAHG